MSGNKSRGGGVIFEHARERKIGATETEIHRGFLRMENKIRQIVARAEPGENAVPVPTQGITFSRARSSERCQPCSWAYFSIPRCRR
jgi:hypothetical protein